MKTIPGITIEQQIAWLDKLDKDMFYKSDDTHFMIEAIRATLVAAQTRLLPELPPGITLQSLTRTHDYAGNEGNWNAIVYGKGAIRDGSAACQRAAVITAIAKIKKVP